MESVLPRVFVGSSSEGLEIAQAVRSLLSSDSSITLWNEGFFRHGHGFLERLTTSLDEFDFAIIVATSDDLLVSQGEVRLSPRDNLIFELGLFMGKLGRTRTFLVHPRDIDFKLPTDLLGIATTSYIWSANNSDTRRYMASLGPACDEIRDSLREWRREYTTNVLTDPGLIRCYTNPTDAQAAIGRGIASTRSEIFLMGTNFSYTPVLNVAELQDRIEQGINIRFLVLNPLSELIPTIAADFLIPAGQLYDENRLHLKTLHDFKLHSEAVHARRSGNSGKVEIRLYDAPPRMRCYIFDGATGESFFVPYANRALSRPLPVYHCRGGMGIARRYLAGVEHLWVSASSDIVEFLESHPDFLPN